MSARHSPDLACGIEPMVANNFNPSAERSFARPDLIGRGGKVDLKSDTKLVVSDPSEPVHSDARSSHYRMASPSKDAGTKRINESLPVRKLKPSSHAMATDLPQLTRLALCDRIVNISVIEAWSPWAFWVQIQSKNMDLQDLNDKLE
jgi:hypothetical protein